MMASYNVLSGVFIFLHLYFYMLVSAYDLKDLIYLLFFPPQLFLLSPRLCGVLLSLFVSMCVCVSSQIWAAVVCVCVEGGCNEKERTRGRLGGAGVSGRV